jgi:formiminotetrahydrofolate cyclodeaminase
MALESSWGGAGTAFPSLGADALGAGGGTAGGAAAGSALGPIGALAGAGLSAGTSIFDFGQKRKAQKKAEAESRPKHRRLTKIKESLDEQQEKKMASMAALSAAAMQWAQMV